MSFWSRTRLKRTFRANYLEAVYPENKDRNLPDYKNSEAPYCARIARLAPVSHLILVGESLPRDFNEDKVAAIARRESPEAVHFPPGPHPFSAYFNRGGRRAVLARMVQAFIETIHRYE